MNYCLHTAGRMVRRGLRRVLGASAVADSEDRRLLEQLLLPHYASRTDIGALLFVGTRWYTRHYAAPFAGKRFVTLDVDARAARHGSGEHIVGDVCELARWLDADTLDAVILNGVFGWGLDTRVQMQCALLAIAHALRPQGELVVGWNETPRRAPFDFRSLPALRQRFEPLPFAPLGGAVRIELPTDNRHCFAFFRRL